MTFGFLSCRLSSVPVHACNVVVHAAELHDWVSLVQSVPSAALLSSSGLLTQAVSFDSLKQLRACLSLMNLKMTECLCLHTPSYLFQISLMNLKMTECLCLHTPSYLFQISLMNLKMTECLCLHTPSSLFQIPRTQSTAEREPDGSACGDLDLPYAIFVTLLNVVSQNCDKWAHVHVTHDQAQPMERETQD